MYPQGATSRGIWLFSLGCRVSAIIHVLFHFLDMVYRTSHLLVDNSCGRIIACLIGALRDSNWACVHSEACKAFVSAGKNLYTKNGNHKHRHGSFCAISCGISYGRGQKVSPSPLCPLYIPLMPLRSSGTSCTPSTIARYWMGF